ncbi:hypothetical protein [Allofournierella sp.]
MKIVTARTAHQNFQPVRRRRANASQVNTIAQASASMIPVLISAL